MSNKATKPSDPEFPDRGKLFVVSAPAGTGKTTLVNRLVHELTHTVQTVSYTTREKRQGEIEGVHYHFVDRDKFEEMIQEGLFLEYVTLYGDYYGTSKAAIERDVSSGLHVILVIDTQGALKLKESNIKAFYLFISPPSLETLRQRLEGRKSESQDKIEERLKVAKHELERKRYYDFEIVNDNLEQAYQKFKKLIIREEKP